MKRKLLFIISICGIIILLIIQSQILKQNAKKEILTKEIVIFKKDIEAGVLISEEMIEYSSFLKSSIPIGVVENKKDVVGYYTSKKVNPKDFIFHNDITSEPPKNNVVLNEELYMVTLKFDAAELANVFKLHIGQFVELVFIPNNDSNNEIEKTIKTRILDIKDLNLNSISEKDFDIKKAKYITFEVEEKIAERILKNVNKGKFAIYND